MPRKKFTGYETTSWQQAVISKDLSTPPGSPSEGDRYIVGPSATGAWNGHDNEIAEWDGTEWDFIVISSCHIDIIDEDKEYRYSGSSWIDISSNVDGGRSGTVYTVLDIDGGLA